VLQAFSVGSGANPGQKRICQKATGGNHFEYSEHHVSQQNDQNLVLANMTVSDGVSPSAQRVGAEPACPPPL